MPTSPQMHLPMIRKMLPIRGPSLFVYTLVCPHEQAEDEWPWPWRRLAVWHASGGPGAPEALQGFTRVLCYAFLVDEYILIII